MEDRAMKKKYLLLPVFIMFALFSCNTEKAEGGKQAVKTEQKAILEKGIVSDAIRDSVETNIEAGLGEELLKQRAELTAEALATIVKTQNLLGLIEKGDSLKAVEFGHNLIGQLEVLLTKNPDAQLILVDVDYKINEVVTDIGSVREATKLAKEAIDKGYYQAANEILGNLKSEVVVNSYYIPAATYPNAVKLAVASLEEGRKYEAKSILLQVLNTIVIEEVVVPLPVLKAEQLIVQTARIDKKDHENSEQVIGLLKEAEYQLQLAEEMGYGDKDEDYAVLSEAIESLKESVEKKQDSQNAFDSLKQNIIKFKDRVFSKKQN